jgi:dCTP deaminase
MASGKIEDTFLSIKSDIWIQQQAIENRMIDPFVPSLIREVERDGDTNRVISYGTSSYGADLRLSPKDFRIFRHIPGEVVNPKRFNPAHLEQAPLFSDEDGEYFILPAHTYALGVTIEQVVMPPNITGLLLNKSTMVRCGVVLPATVIEAGWAGSITLEISNQSKADCRIYAGEGIGQLLFFEGEPCEVCYGTRKGKYQNQAPETVTLAKV